MKDRIILGAMVGLLADVVKLLVNLTGYLLNYSHVVFWQITATRFLDKTDLFKPAAYIIGGIADLTMAALLGVAFIYLLHLTGRDYDYVKGMGFGLAVWVLLFGTVLGQTTENKLNIDPSGILLTAVAHLSFGLALTFFSRKLWNRRILPS